MTHCLLLWSWFDAAVAPLRDGQSAFGQITAGTFKYYRLFIDSATTAFTVSLSPLSGSPAIYMIPESTANSAYVLPTQNYYNWSSISQGGRVVTVYSTDPAFSSPATYVVGVTSPSSSAFFITASLSQSLTQLRDGEPEVCVARAV